MKNLTCKAIKHLVQSYIAGLFFLALLFYSPIIHAHDGIKITIFRQYPGDKCTSGYLAINGEIIVYTLERTFIGNINNISSIPVGIYKAFLRYDKKDKWRIELTGVKGREGIQIHIGNWVDNSKGCLLVGEKLGPDLCSFEKGTSGSAYEKLKKAFYNSKKEQDFPEQEITVDIKGETKG